MTSWIIIFVYLFSFTVSFYALTCVKFEEFTKVREPYKVQLLLVLLAIGLGYVVGSFILEMTVYH